MDKLTGDMFKRPEPPKTKLITYTTNCPLCDVEVVVVKEVRREVAAVMEFPKVCNECKSIWARVKKKYTGEDTNVTTKESEKDK